MATRRVIYRLRDGEEGGSTVDYSAPIEAITYSQIAVVRPRNLQHEHGYVRLCYRNGLPVVPTGPTENWTSYHNNDWEEGGEKTTRLGGVKLGRGHCSGCM